MDCAKGVNFLLTNGGQMADYKGFGKATKPMLPSVGVPTTAGTGSEAQSYALIADESTHLKMACGDRKAAFRVAILDPELTVSQPRGVTAVTGIDALAHAVESLRLHRGGRRCRRPARVAAWRLLDAQLRDGAGRAGRPGGPGGHAARRALRRHGHRERHARRRARLRQPADGPLRHDARHRRRPHAAARRPLQRPGGRGPVRRVGRRRARIAQRRAGERAAGPADRRVGGPGRAADRRLRDCGVSEGILPLLAEEANQQWTARFNPRPVGDEELLRVYRAAW